MAHRLRTHPEDQAAQIVAVLLNADAEVVKPILSRLSRDEQRRLAQALIRGQQPTEDHLDETLTAFVTRLKTPLPRTQARIYSASGMGARDPRRDLILRALKQRGAPLSDDDPFLMSLAHDDQIERIRNLCASLDIKLLITLVDREPLAVGALILALAAPETSVALLKRTSAERSAALLMALATKDDVTPEALDALESALAEMHEHRASRLSLNQGQNPSERVASLLRGLDVEKREHILAQLESLSSDGSAAPSLAPAELARDIRKQLLSIAQLAQLLPKDLALVLGELKDADIGRALFVEPLVVRQTYARALSSRRAELVHQELEELDARRGHIRKKDLETSADLIVLRAQNLRNEGRILFPWEDELV